LVAVAVSEDEFRARAQLSLRLRLACAAAASISAAALAHVSSPNVASQTPLPQQSATASATAGSVVAPDVVAPEAVAAVARRLNCPLCQGYTLQDCPLLVCSQMRDLIATRLAAGAAEDEILAEFVDLYGPQVLNAPPFGVVWLVPAVALIAALVVAVVVTRPRGRTRVAAAGGPETSADPGSYAERIEALLAERDG
jgi:cytochrome c-type biogenesis protein CcmH/NrfF